MDIINISKRRFETLEPLVLPNSVFNTECTLHILPQKSKWEANPRLLKKFYITNGIRFGNKLHTINALLDCKETIDIPELVMPEKMVAINGEICGYTMPLIDSINLVEVLKSFDVPSEDKIFKTNWFNLRKNEKSKRIYFYERILFE